MQHLPGSESVADDAIGTVSHSHCCFLHLAQKAADRVLSTQIKLTNTDIASRGQFDEDLLLFSVQVIVDRLGTKLSDFSVSDTFCIPLHGGHVPVHHPRGVMPVASSVSSPKRFCLCSVDHRQVCRQVCSVNRRQLQATGKYEGLLPLKRSATEQIVATSTVLVLLSLQW